MPSRSYRQHRFFEMVMNDPNFARKNNVSQKVAKEFLDEDRKKGLWQTAPKKGDEHKPKRTKSSNEDVALTSDTTPPGSVDRPDLPPIDRGPETQVIMT